MKAETISPFKEAKALLQVHRELSLYALAILQTSDGDVGVECIDNEHVFEIALNLLGVPQTNLPETDEGSGEVDLMHEDFYSRDIWYGFFDVMVIANEDYDGFIDYVTGKKELNAAYNIEQLPTLIYGISGKKKP